MKSMVKGLLALMFGALLWTNGGMVKEAQAQCAEGGSVLYFENYSVCNYPLGGCQQHPPGQIPQNCLPSSNSNNNTSSGGSWTVNVPAREKPSSYGAVAWGANALGRSSNQATKQSAIEAALQSCGQSDCTVATWYGNQCVAMSYGIQAGNKYLWKTAVGASNKTAEKNALSACKKGGAKSCKVHFSECSLSENLGTNQTTQYKGLGE